MRYVVSDGELYRLSNVAYKRLLRHIAQGEQYAPECLRLMSSAVNLGPVHSITDMSSGWAEHLLGREEKK